MPRWTEPSREQQIAAIESDLAAARALLRTLPPVARDRVLVVATIRHLHDELVVLYSAAARAERHHPALRQHVADVVDTVTGAWHRIERSQQFLAESRVNAEA
jgi:hypothetical protein